MMQGSSGFLLSSITKSFLLSYCLVLACAAFGQDRIGSYAEGFESGMSPRFEYQRVRRLWVDVEPTHGGLLVTGLYPNSPALRMRSRDGRIKRAKLEPNDVILSIDGKATATPQDLANGLSTSGQLCELVVRDQHSGNNQVWFAEPVWANMPVQRIRTQAMTAAQASPSKLYAIIVAATNDPSLGPFIEQSLSELQTHLTVNIKVDRISLQILKGEECSLTTLLASLDGLQTDVNDSLLVYYLGHGAYDPRFEPNDPYGGHFLDLPGADILRKTLWDHMESCYARLRVLVTDSCNVESVIDPDARYRFEQKTRQVTTRGSTPIEWLFLGHRGRCDLGAASKGQFAWYSQDLGGWFTNQWVATSAKASSWTDVRDRVIPATEELYATKKREYQANPATTKPAAIAQLTQQEKMTPQILLTRLKRDAEDPIGIAEVRTFSPPSTVRIREP